MPFSKVLGQATAVETLTHAVLKGRVHHAYRFEGPDGVGKELAALSLAQALVCEAPTPFACETCSSCERAISFTTSEPRVPRHLDVVVLERGLYPSKTLGLSHPEATGISVEQVRRLVLARVGLLSHEARALVFIVRRAEELTEQASNALLKTLEEPGPRVYFILLTSRPHRLLDTLRSRSLPIRFGALADGVIGSILSARGLDPGARAWAQGSASLAITLSDEEARRERERFVAQAFEAIDAPDLATAIGFAERPESRDALAEELGFFAQAVALRGRAACSDNQDRALDAALQHREILSSMVDLERGQPLLVLERLMSRLRQTRVSRA
jgi:DNA polymerase-3 subunit delta'